MVCKAKNFIRKIKTSLKYTSVILIYFLVVGCVNISQKQSYYPPFHSVELTHVMDCDCDIRALHVDKQHIFFAGSNGKYGYLNTADHSIEYLGTVEENGKNPEFRGLVRTKKNDFIMSVANPGLVYKVNFFGSRKLVYKQASEATFFDAIKFWNDSEGLIIGDPEDGCMTFLITRDEGNTWNRVDCDILGPAEENEGAFAASNSNITMITDHAWVIAGGEVSKVYFTRDKGESWIIYDTPIRNDKPTTGGYTMDFHNIKTGIIMGGDYLDPQNNKGNKALTKNAGKSWHLIADGQNPGYMSSVKFVPNSDGNEIVAVGPTGIYYSSDGGHNWKMLSNESFHTIEFLNDFIAYAAGKGKIVQLTFSEN